MIETRKKSAEYISLLEYTRVYLCYIVLQMGEEEKKKKELIWVLFQKKNCFARRDCVVFFVVIGPIMALLLFIVGVIIYTVGAGYFARACTIIYNATLS